MSVCTMKGVLIALHYNLGETFCVDYFKLFTFQQGPTQIYKFHREVCIGTLVILFLVVDVVNGLGTLPSYSFLLPVGGAGEGGSYRPSSSLVVPQQNRKLLHYITFSVRMLQTLYSVP